MSAETLSEQTKQSMAPPAGPGTFASNIRWLLRQVQAVKQDCRRTLKFTEEGDEYLSDSSFQHDFMEQNFNGTLPPSDREHFEGDGAEDDGGWLKTKQVLHITGCLNELQAITRTRI